MMSPLLSSSHQEMKGISIVVFLILCSRIANTYSKYLWRSTSESAVAQEVNKKVINFIRI